MSIEIQLSALIDNFKSWQKTIQRKNASIKPEVRNLRRIEIINAYNTIVRLVQKIFDTNDHNLKEIAKESIIEVREKLKSSLKILNSEVQFPIDLREQIKIETLKIKMSEFEYLSNISRIIKDTYNGDPLGLNSFISSIDLANSITKDATNQPHLVKFIITKLQGKALEAIPENVNNATEIINALKAKIKPETTDVVVGRLLALRSDKSSLKSFQEQADILADALRRSYISDGIPQNTALKMTVKKTVEMCRLSAKSDLVKSVLAATHFDEPKEVLAKFITESNQESSETRILAFGRYNPGNRGKGNFRGNFNNYRGNNYNNRSNSFRRNNNFRNNFQNNNRFNTRTFNNRGNFRGNYRQNNNNQNRNQNDRYIRVTVPENQEGPSMGRATEQQTQESQQERILRIQQE